MNRKKLSLDCLLLIIAIISFVLLAGCVNSSSENHEDNANPEAGLETTGSQTIEMQTFSSGSDNSPKYGAGDIIYRKKTADDGLWVILGYDPEKDEYVTDVIFKLEDGSWGYRINDVSSTENRKFMEDNYQVLIGHIEPEEILIGIPASSEGTGDENPSNEPLFVKGDIIWDEAGTDIAYIVLDYNSENNQYKLNNVQSIEGVWYIFEDDMITYQSGSSIEETFSDKLGNVNPDNIPVLSG